MTLPAIFDGIYDPLPMYQLASICRLHYNPTEPKWQLVGNGLRRHLRRDTIFASGGAAPPTVALHLSDHDVVIVQGSTDFFAWYLNSRNLVMTMQGAVGVASGFWSMAQAIAANFTLLGLGGNRPVVFVGHSMGGAIATCLAKIWKSTEGWDPNVQVVTFGSPRVGNFQFYQGVEDVHARCVFNRDIVTQIPANGGWYDSSSLLATFRVTPYTHGGILLWYNPEIGRFMRFPQWNATGWEAWQNQSETRSVLSRSEQLNADVNDHRIWSYTQAWRRLVRNAPRYTLESFDQLNSGINDTTGELWDAGVLTSGYETQNDPLPEDPIETGPIPGPSPPWDPAQPDPVPPTPPGASIPPTRRQLMQRHHRRQRNF